MTTDATIDVKKRVRGALLVATLASACGSSAALAPMDASSEIDASGDLSRMNAGCGKALPGNQPMTVSRSPAGYLRYTVTATGATLADPVPAKAGPRTFWVRVPSDYDPNRKYRVVYIGQHCGGYDSANTTALPLYKAPGGEEAIYVAIDLPANFGDVDDCYDDQSGTSSEEWEAFELFHGVVDANYCVDNDNVFAAGYSSGGTLANMWGCYFAGDGERPWNGVPGGDGATAPTPRRFAPRYHIKGQAAVTATEPANNPPCNGPIAAIWVHDMQDPVPLAGDQAALARVLRMDGCEGSPTVPWHAEMFSLGTSCLRYTACPANDPVIFCTTNEGAHTDHEVVAIPAFKLFFDEASAAAPGPP